ncbi:MAG: hypothetical protein V4722_03735 [Bacteroidota bacterium]
MHRTRFLYLAASDLGIIATFLPWEKISVLGVVSESHAGTQITESILGTMGVGWISLVLFAIAAAISFTGKRASPLNPSRRWILLVLGILTAVIGVHTYLDVKQKAITNPQENGGLSFESSAGIGIYLVIAAGAALVLMSLFLKERTDQTE